MFFMAKILENDLKIHIKNRTFSPVYIIYGDEPYYIYHYVNKISDSAILEFNDLNSYKADGEDINVDELLNACMTLPMFNDYRTVVVRDIKLGENESEDQKILEYVENPNKSTILVLYFIATNPPKTGKWKRLFSAAESVGSIVEIKKKSLSEISKILCTVAGKRCCTMSLKTAEQMIFCCGDDMFTLFSEMDKLCAFKSGGEITFDDVDLLCSKTISAKAYYISKEINRKNCAKALSIFNELYDSQKDANYLLYPLSSPYIDMYYYLVARNSNQNPVQLAKELGYKKPEMITYSQNDANSLGLEKVVECLEVLFETDRILKTVSTLDEKILMEKTIVKLCEIVKKR